MTTASNTPSKELLKVVRAALILRGLSLSKWAELKGVKRQNLTKALDGTWTGPKASDLINEVLQDLKVRAE